MISVTIASYSSQQGGETALHRASDKGHPEVVELLMQSHADVNVKNKVSTESPRYYHFTPYNVNLLLKLIGADPGSEKIWYKIIIIGVVRAMKICACMYTNVFLTYKISRFMVCSVT